MINPVFLVLLLPLAGYIILKSENVNFNPKKLTALFFIVLLLIIPPTFSFQPAHADNNIRQIVKIFETYPVDVASVDFVIDPPLLNIDKTIVFFTVSHTGESDTSDVFRSVEIIDENTLRVKGESTATGNQAVDIIAYVVEFDANSDIDVQHITESLSATSGSQSFSMGSINTTNSMIVSRGQHYNASATTTGDNDFNRIRIVDSTNWEVNIDTAPITPQGQLVDIVDFNQTDISVQRGLFTMVNPSLTGEVTPPTAVDPTRTMLMVTYTSDGASDEDSDDIMLRSMLSDGGVIRFERADNDSELLVAWELIEFPADMVRIKHFNSTIPDGSLSVVVEVPEIKDFDKAMAISHTGSPFGFSTGESDECCEVAGATDQAQAKFLITNNTRVDISRDDSTGDNIQGWQLVEILENTLPEKSDGLNTLLKVHIIKDEFTGTSTKQDYTISPPLTDLDDHILFLTLRDDLDGTADVSERFWRWEVTAVDTLTIHGTNDPSATQNGMNFTATILEMDSSSPIFAQYDELQYTEDILAGEKIMQMSPVNDTGSFIVYDGWTSTFGDTTVGQEEIFGLRIINGSTWGYDVEQPTDEQESAVKVQIVDLNSNATIVQRGSASLTGASLTVSPAIDVVRNQTILMATHTTTGSDFEEEPDEIGLLAFLDDSSPPDIIFERVDGTAPSLEIQWTLIEIFNGGIFIEHGRHNQTAGVSNGTETLTGIVNASNAFALGTVFTPVGHANGKGTYAVDDKFNEIFFQVTLESNSTIRFERDGSTGSAELGWQSIEMLSPMGVDLGQEFNQTVTDTVTIAPEDLIFDINKTAVDFSSYVDVSTNKNVTKLGTDVIGSADTVNTNSIFVIELSDQGEAIDVLSLNITKLAEETIGSIDQTNLAITKALQDTVTVNDQVIANVTFLLSIIDSVGVSDELRLEITKALTELASTSDDTTLDIDKTIADITTIIDQADAELIAEILELDSVTANDEVRLTVLKAILDTVLNQDEINFVVDKLLQDSATISDLTDTTVAFGLEELDTVTANDLVILDVTKQLFDVASAIDDLDLEATKVFLDTASIIDSTQASTDSGVNQTDIVSVPEDITFDVTKLIQNIAGIQDQVVVVRELNLAVNDTVIVNDPAIFFTIATVIPNGTGAPASSGGGVPSGLPTFQRLVGLNIISELFFIEPSDVVPSDFIINTFGRESSTVSIIEIEASQEFISWFDFSAFPDPLNFETTVDSSRTLNDPARFKNTALDDFVLNIPNLACSEVDPFATPVPCIDPIIYEVPLTFTFKKGGAEFKEKHIVTVDASTPIVCDPICQFVAFITENYWWLAGILIMFMMLYFLGGAVKRKGIRTTRRINKSHFNSFEATGRKQVKTKFKKGKR